MTDAAMLDRVLFRLAACSDDELETPLARLLPKVISAMDQPASDQALQKKVLEVLAYVNGRLANLPALRLPVEALVEGLAGAARSAPFFLVYLEKGLARMPAAEAAATAPALLGGASARPPAQQTQLLHVFLASVPHLDLSAAEAVDLPSAAAPAAGAAQGRDEEEKEEGAAEEDEGGEARAQEQEDGGGGGGGGGGDVSGRQEEDASNQQQQAEAEARRKAALLAQFPFLGAPADRKLVLQFLLDVLLYPGGNVAAGAPPPPGLSRAALERLTRGGRAGGPTTSAASLLAAKTAVLRLVSARVFAPNEVLPHLLVAASVGTQDVTQRGESELRRLKGVDAEGRALALRLVRLFVGDAGTGLPEAQQRTGASVAVRARVMGVLSGSAAAANLGNASLKLAMMSLLAPGTNTRLHLAGIEFVSWMIRKAEPAALRPAVGPLLSTLLKVVKERVQPKAPAPGEAPAPAAAGSAASLKFAPHVRALAFNAVGQLSAVAPAAFCRGTQIAALLFGALRAEGDEVVLQNVHEALGLLRPGFAGATPEVAEALLTKVLLPAAAPGRTRREQLAALQFMREACRPDDARPRFACALMAHETSSDVRDEARRSLGAETFREHDPADGAVAEAEAEVVVGGGGGGGDRGGDDDVDDKDRFPSLGAFVGRAASELERMREAGAPARPAVLSTVLRFSTECVRRAGAPAAEVVGREEGAVTRLNALVEEAMASPHPALQADASGTLLQLVRWAPGHLAPLYAARADWIVRQLLERGEATRVNVAELLGLMAPELDRAAAAALLRRLVAEAAACTASGTLDGLAAVATARAEPLHGAVMGAGALAAFWRRLPEGERGADPWRREDVDGAVRCLVDCVGSKSPPVAAAACRCLARLGGAGALPLPAGTGSRDVARALLSKATAKTRAESRVAEEALAALGKIAAGDRRPATLSLVLRGLFSMSRVKHEEVHFAVGRAFADACRGADGEPSFALGAEGDGAADADEAEAETKKAEEKRAEDADSPKDEAAAAAAAAAAAERTAMGHFLDRVLRHHIPRGSAVARSAACTWLLCVLKFAGAGSAELRAALPRVQAALSAALADSNQLVQEVASKAMAVVYELGDAATRRELVESLLSTFSSQPSAAASRVTGDTEVQTNPERGEVATYRDLCGVARDMGQPALMYRFLDLATHHAVWNSRAGAAFSLGSILQASEDLAPRLGALVPKLYRYQHDPNPKVQTSMAALWRSLVPDPKATVAEHFGAIVAELLRAAGSRQYRARESAAAGLLSLLPSRDYASVGPHLEDAWAACFRLLDDVKESVRKAGNALARGLARLTARLCDPRMSGAAVVAGSLGAVLPLLLERGVAHKVREVRAVSIACVVDLTRVSGRHLRPHLAAVVGTLLETTSSVEPAVFSYLQFHTAKMGVSQEDLERARLSAAKSSPLAGAVDSCARVVDEASLPSVVSRLREIIAAGLGLPTLIAAAGVAEKLATGPMAPHMRPHAGGLMRALLDGLADRSPSVRKAYASAVGYLCRVAKNKRVGITVRHMVDAYLADDADDERRAASGAALAAVARRAPEVARAFCADLAPAAFVGIHDPHAATAAHFSDIWDDVLASRQTGVRLYLAEIVDLASRLLADSASWVLKAAALRALEEAARVGGAAFASRAPSVLAACVDSLGGRVWSGKDVTFDVIAALFDERGADLADAEARRAAAAVLAQCRRGKRSYKLAALAAVVRLAAARPGVVGFAEARAALEPALAEQAAAAEAAGKEAAEAALGAGADVGAAAAVERKAQAAGGEVVAATLAAVAACLPPLRAAGGEPAAEGVSDADAEWLLREVVSRLTGADRRLRVGALRAAASAAARVPAGALGAAAVSRLVDELGMCLSDGRHATIRVHALDAVRALLERASSDDGAVRAAVFAHAPALRARLDSLERDDKDAQVLLAAARARKALPAEVVGGGDM